MNKNKFHNSLMGITFGLLHESFHIRELEYLKRTENIEQEELFDDLLISNNQKAYKKHHDSLLIERAANEYAINNLPYVLQRIVPEKELISYQNKLKRKIKLNPANSYIKNKEKLVQDAKDLLTPEGVEQVKEIYNKK